MFMISDFLGRLKGIWGPGLPSRVGTAWVSAPFGLSVLDNGRTAQILSCRINLNRPVEMRFESSIAEHEQPGLGKHATCMHPESG